MDRKRLRSAIWHPYKGLWNRAVLRVATRPTKALNHLVIASVVAADTSILFMRAVARRVALAGPGSILSGVQVGADTPVVYLDLGTHREGAELRWMAEDVLPRCVDSFAAYGFEASERSFAAASEALSRIDEVEVVRVALVHEVPEGGTVRLHTSQKGLKDSIHRPAESFEDVTAQRLSDWLSERGIDLGRSVCLLRMNIEGAEFDVLEDLVERNLAGHIDGFYGMWDDLYKFDRPRDRQFRSFLVRHGISSLAFNGRDMRWCMRLRCIRYDVHTSLMAGARRVGRA